MLTTAKKFAVLIDIDNVVLSLEDLKKIMTQVEVLGEIAYAKFYGYSDRKHKELETLINSGAYETAQRMRNKKKNKSQQDIRMIIDGVKLACSNQALDSFCIVGGTGDFVPFISTLKSLGRYVVGGFVGDAENCGACHHDLRLTPPNEIKIPRAEPMKIPRIIETIKIEKPKGNKELDALELDKILNTAIEEEKSLNVEDVLKQIERVVNDFADINND